MANFGWSYPPGCNSVPGDEDAGPCDVCGQSVYPDRCICPECPICGSPGDPLCYFGLSEGASRYTGHMPCGADMEVNRYQLVAKHICDAQIEASLKEEAEYWDQLAKEYEQETHEEVTDDL